MFDYEGKLRAGISYHRPPPSASIVLNDKRRVRQVSFFCQVFCTQPLKAEANERIRFNSFLRAFGKTNIGENKMAKAVYRAPVSGQPLITTISSGCKTPLLEIKYCNLVKPFYYANSPTVPRYSVTCFADPSLHKEFLKGIQTIENNEKVESILKQDYVKKDEGHVTTGKVIVKFQSKDLIPVYLGTNGESSETPATIELEDELARGEKIVIVYDILRYTKKNTIKTEHGLSFKPSCIYYYPSTQLDTAQGE